VSEPATGTRVLAAPMRNLLYTAGALVFGAGFQLFVLTEYTAEYFAWTIDPPLTAACLGASYWAAMLLELSAARATRWVDARVAVPGVLLFTALTNIPIFQNLPAYNLDNPAAWVWVAVYLFVPFLLAGALWHQLRQPGVDPARGEAPPLLIRGALAFHAVLFLGMGFGLLLAPELAGPFWPWDLNPGDSMYGGITEPYFGCWGLGLGLVAAQAAWENDMHRLRPAFPAYVALGGFQLIAVARYPETLSWDGPAAWLWVGLLASILITGVAGLLAGRGRTQPTVVAAASPTG